MRSNRLSAIASPAARRWAGLALSLTALIGAPAQAVPSFTRQTGMECTGCHIGGFGPQLTPAGMRFKLGGYTDTDGKGTKIPLSGMVVVSGTHTSKAQDPPPEHLKGNDNYTLDEASLFIAGRFSDHIGSFIQITRDGIAHSNGLDQTDVRLATTTELGGQDAVLGLTLNNNPGVQDPLHTMPIWSFPFVGSPSAFGSGDAATLLNGGLEGRVLGLSAYTLFANSVYAELGSYRSMTPKLQDKLGLGRDLQRLGGNAYWRLAWMPDRKSDAWHVGVFGWNARLQPDREAGGLYDTYKDVGIDGGYQFLGTRENIWTVAASVLNENKREGETGLASHLSERRLAATYSWQQTWGASAGLFSTLGSDPAATTRGQLLQADFTPWGKEGKAAPSPISWANLRVGLQYWHYNVFGGTRDGASDHDGLFLFAWSAF